MPSRRLLSPPRNYGTQNAVPPLLCGLTVGFSCLLLLGLCFRRIRKKRTVPSASDTDSKKPPHSLSYAALRRATRNFSPALRLGQGGFGSVYIGELNTDPPYISSRVAVKLMDSGSLQGEREFQNELLFSSKIDSRYVVSVLGFSSNPKKRRMLLVYELMENGSLQDCLFHKKSDELRNWDKRFTIAVNIAKGLEYLHHCCDPPIIHGDIKPSNVLLDGDFNAKIGDFGLARFKPDINVVVEDNASALEDSESVITTSVIDIERSPESVYASPEGLIGVPFSPETAAVASPFEGLDKGSSISFDRCSIESTAEIASKKKNAKDWWWKQETESRRVKDYVMEWIGNEISKERSTTQWVEEASSSSKSTVKKKKTKKKRQLDWWVSLDDEKSVKNERRRRPAREWWKEEYCEELERKKRKKKKQSSKLDVDDDGFYSETKSKRSRARSRSRDSTDRWLDGDFFGARRKNGCNSISSTPSMRGTVCYVAPEYGGGDDDNVSEKCDVYSYGVVLLVLVAGRRPLQVTGSPISEFQRANLVTWARNLARAGKLPELIDRRIVPLNEEQAALCINVALLCLQKAAANRPSMKEVVGMLSGDLVLPSLPVEFSPSPQSKLPFRGRKKAR